MQDKYLEMTTKPVNKLITRLALPTILSMLVTNIYNSADAYFIGKINPSAQGAIGIVLSVMAIIQAVGFMFGQGSGNNISRLLGARNYKQSRELAAVGFFVSIICGIIITIIGNIFIRQIAMLLGSTKTILPYATDYLKIILIGAPYMCGAIVLNVQLRFQGNANLAMIGLVSGGILNIILDPIFIFTLKFGIEGAAIATTLSQLISFLILLYMVNVKGQVKIKFQNFKPTLESFKLILNGGTPSLLRQSISSISVIVLNTAANPFGDVAIAAMTVVGRVVMTTVSIVVGLGQGYQPVCGYNLGAKKTKRVIEGFNYTVKISLIFLVVLSFFIFIFGEKVSEFFSNDANVIEIATKALKYASFTMWSASYVIISNMMLQTMGKVFQASFIGLSRQGIFLIPLLLILPKYMGLTGLLIAQPIADIISLLITIICQEKVIKEMKREALA